jgi:hypothetical protein
MWGKFVRVILLVLLSTLFVFDAKAAVWEVENQWTPEYDKKYRDWIKSDKVHRKLFTKRGTIFYNFPTDCADMIYVLRLVFAYENKLPFVLTAPSDYTEEGPVLSQATTKFDHIESEKGKVKAFMHYVSQEKGTNSMIKDTFPVAVKEITSGDMYVTQWSFIFMGTNNHSYIIKEIARDGNGLFYASDAPRKVWKLQKTKKYPDFVFKSKPWGYRRWRKPEHILTPEKEIPASEGLSYEQYDLLYRYGADKVLLEIRKRMRR